ncbi:MAG TPA: two-component regulator propeller domain-containing protein [Bryobacteraceae bacterium]|nr:two-component regulator propeller domain-containing protein [Bryobacteraceae bacterium]
MHDYWPIRCFLIGLIAFATGIFPINTAYAIDPNRAMSQYVHDRWGSDKGFPRGPVYAIAQTTDGYLWIGTEAGLVQFDGWSFRTVKDDSGAFTITSVLGLMPDNGNCLWLQLQDLNVLRYCNGVFGTPASDPQSYTAISAMSRTIQGDILLSRMGSGAFTFRAGRLQMLAAGDLPRSPVISLAQTPNGDIWMGSRDSGLFRRAGGKTFEIRNGLPDAKINCLLPDGNSDLWIGTDNGLVRWNGSELTTAGIPASLNHFQVLTMARDRDSNIWVGTDSRGLLRFNSQGVASLNQSGGAASEAITALFEDREGSLWIGSANGLERLRDSAFVTYSLPEGLPTDGSNPVYVDSANRMWFPPVDGGLWWVKDGKHGQIHEAGLDGDVVYSIAGGEGELWLGRKRGGLTHLHFKGESVTAETYTESDGLAQNSVYSVYRSRDQAVWAGTLSRGVSRLSQGKFTTYTSASGLASNTVASILETSDGAMWFATPNGLSALANGRWKTYTRPDGLPSEDVNCLLQDSRGVLWVGTAAGLAFRSAASLIVPAGVPSSLREPILGLAEDKYGWLWMSTSNHVLRVHRDNLMRGTLGDGDIREYGPADGLRGVEGVKRHLSVVTDVLGRIWFSLNRGISVVDPGRLTNSSAPAFTYIQQISADGNAISLRDPIRIPPHHHRTVFGYVGLSLSVPERVRYRYRLDRFDHGWSEPVAEREEGYTNLPPGSYRFRVMASNSDGVWSKNEAVISFAVDPLFWQTWWFRFSVVLACALAVFALYRFRLHQLTSRLNVGFEERLAERTRIAQELHDTLLQGFLSASMHVHVAADRLAADSPERRILTRALQLMAQVIEEGRNAVRGLRASESASLDIEQAFSHIQDELAQEKVDFRVIVDGERRPLRPVLRDEVYRIGREALLNAFRHARAKSIEVELKYTTRHLYLLVRDDGCGIDPQVVGSGRDGHWGLSGMRQRADRIGARFHVFSSATAGTEIELSVPSHVAFEDQGSRRLRWPGWRPARRNNSSEGPEDRNGKGE